LSRPRLTAAFISLAAVVALTTAAPALATGGAPDVGIIANQFVTPGGPIRLLGVNGGPGAGDACVQPLYDKYRVGGWDGPVDDRAVATMASWKINTVRIGLNEDCWLGINPVRRTGYPGNHYGIHPIRRHARSIGRRLAAGYRSRIKALVNRVHAHGLIAILDLHWTAPGHTIAWNQWPLPDADHSPAFWRSVAATFKDDHSVALELFNEPFMRNPSRLRWSCLRDGCTLPNGATDALSSQSGPSTKGCGRLCPDYAHPAGSYRTAGFQRLVDVIRGAGSSAPIIASGRYYSNDLGQWLQYKPQDPLNGIAAAFHSYQGLPCDNVGCWERDVAPIAAQVPVVTTEFGPDTYNKREPCDTGFDETFMSWADARAVSYLAWAWYVGDERRPKCSLDLITDWYSATPRPGHGQAVHDHLAALP
jgi:hypothetical protein